MTDTAPAAARGDDRREQRHHGGETKNVAEGSGRNAQNQYTHAKVAGQLIVTAAFSPQKAQGMVAVELI